MSVTVANSTAQLSGKTLVRAEDTATVTGLWTFSRGSNAPFAVAANAGNVANLDADKVDGKDASAFALLAGANAFVGNQGITGSLTVSGVSTLASVTTTAAVTVGTDVNIVGRLALASAGLGTTVTLAAGGNNNVVWDNVVSVIPCTPNAAGSNITGLTAPSLSGAVVVYVFNNSSSVHITFTANDAASSLANRFTQAYDLSPQTAVGFIYISSILKWALIGGLS